MLTRRNFIVILLLFLIVFVMFISVEVSAFYLTQREYNPQSDVPITLTKADAFSSDVMEDPQAAKSPELAARALAHEKVAIITADPDAQTVQVMKEWCTYSRYRYQVYSALPTAEEITDFRVLLFDAQVIHEDALPMLQAYAALGLDMIITALPSYQELAQSPELCDFLGIEALVQESLPIKGFHIFDDFLVGGEKIYGVNDYYGNTDDDIPASVPYYTLRPGYLMYAQAIAVDDSIDYKDLPGLLWRTRTDKSNVYVINTDVFDGKSLIGLLTAFLSQSQQYYVYPVVNAQTISILDFPLLANENNDTIQARYSRSSESVGRDVLWPGIVKILRNYGNYYHFFMAPELNYADDTSPSAEFISFYRREIERLSGTMGLSLHQMSDIPLPDLCGRNAAFLQEHMPAYQFTAAYATEPQVTGLASADQLPSPLEAVSLVMTDMSDTAPLISYVNDRTLCVSFITDGFVHESMDDLRLSCLETALGMNNQKVSMSRVFYPGADDSWNTLNLLWSKGDTYFKPYLVFDNVSVYEMEARVRAFLSVDYAVNREDDILTVSVTNDVKGASFVLRLFNDQIDHVEGGQLRKLSSTAYLLQPEEQQMRLFLKTQNKLANPPTTYQEVIQQ